MSFTISTTKCPDGSFYGAVSNSADIVVSMSDSLDTRGKARGWAQREAARLTALSITPIAPAPMVPQVAQQAQGQDMRPMLPILERLAMANAELAACDRQAKPLNWNRIFEAREAMKLAAVASDPVAYVRAYPSHAFAYRHLLPADMAARVEVAETDVDMVRAVAEPEVEAFSDVTLAAEKLTGEGFKRLAIMPGYWAHDDGRRAAVVWSGAGQFYVRRFASPSKPAPVMVPQPCQQQQGAPLKGPQNVGRVNSTHPDGKPRYGWFDARCINSVAAPYLNAGEVYRLREVRNGWYETEGGDRMAKFRFEKI